MMQRIRKLINDRFDNQCHRIWATYQCAKITHATLESFRHNLSITKANNAAYEVVDVLLDESFGVLQDAEERFSKIRNSISIENRCWP